MTLFMSYTKQAAAFGKLVGICAGFEGKYNPAHQNLTITAIRNLSATAEAANLSVIVARQNWVAATGKRRNDFRDLEEMLKRLRSEVKNMEADPGTKKLLIRAINTAATFNKGASNDPPAESGAEPKSKRSTASDFATRTAAFEELISALGTNPGYIPSAPDLHIEALQSKMVAMKARTAEVNSSFAAFRGAQSFRRQVFNQPGTGIIATACRIRNVIKAIFGNPSDELKAVRSAGISG
jgi:hypothetical protein